MLSERAKKWPEEGRQAGIKKGIEEGLKEGQEQARIENARKMIEKTVMNDELIAELSGLDVIHVNMLRKELVL